MKQNKNTQAALPDYQLIDDEEGMERFYSECKDCPWLGFDTEFIGERRFVTLLCLIQISSPHGYYLIDAIRLKKLARLFEILEDPKIIKITHAGENDYRLLYQQFKVIPQNLFDTQIAAGFVGYRYPLSFAKLVAKETKHRPGKGFTVSDWQSRPLTTKQIRYALEDVVPLHELYLKLSSRIENMGRTTWFRTELSKYEVPGLFKFNPYKEAFQNNLIKNMSRKEQLFLLRIYKWRVDLARERDHSKEMVMPNKYISFVLKNIKAGKAALLGHRRLPPDVVKKHWSTFEALYESEATPQELELLTKLPPGVRSKAEENITIDLLINLLRFHCQSLKLAPELVLTGINTKRMRMDPTFFDDGLEKGWRAEVLGSGLINAFKNQKAVDIDLNDQRALISLS